MSKRCLFVALVCIGLGFGRSLASPSAEEIIEQVKARSTQGESEKSQYCYQRVSRVDYFDEDGTVKKNSVRVYEVAPVDGRPVSKLVQVNGRAPTAKQEARTDARKTGDEARTLALGEDVLSRYTYELVGEESVGERQAWILAFQPRRDAREDGYIDKLLNAMQGRMWVDQQDFELAKIDVHLGKKVSFFGGLAGAIEKLDLTLIQRRVDPAAWLTEGLSLDLSARKLFTPVRLRCFENCSNFRKESPLAKN